MIKWLRLVEGKLIRRYHHLMFYLIQRTDVNGFKPAAHIDPAYADELKNAYYNGVDILVYDVKIDTRGISINRPIPFDI